MVGCGKIARTFKRGLTARLPAANRKTKNAAASENPNTTITATAMLSSTLPVRPAFWNVPLWAEIGVYIIGLIAVIVCAAGIIRVIRERRSGAAPETPEGPRKRRIANLFCEVLGQSKVMRGASGKAHLAIFWGCIFLFWGTATATLDWDVGHYVFGQQFLTGRFYLIYKLILDTAGLAALIGLGYGAWRRFVAHDERVESNGRFACLIASLAAIIITGFFVEALRLAVQQPAWREFSPVGNLLSQLFAGSTPEFLTTAHLFLWVVHGLASLIFIAAVPLTFYSHIFKTPISIFWQKVSPAGAIAKIDNIEEQETFGISKYEQFTWRDRARFDGCTECGRCRGVCPAVKADTPLDPKSLIMTLRDRMRDAANDKELIGGLVSRDALWSCTTCGACARACPTDIPIPDLIVLMRRHLALETGEFPEGLAGALENTASVGNPWGMDPGSRLAWAKDLDVPVAKPGVAYDVLYWVGCSASYDRRAQKIARAMVKILKAAGIHFAVMQEERCHGDFARRAGEEYLFQTAAAENIENLRKYQFKELVAACPHCFNTLKNEYPQFEGGTFNCVSHTVLIDRLITEGRIKVSKSQFFTVMHDPCYLARMNGITAEPRRVLETLGAHLREAKHSKADTLCCGAGGAQIFMDRPARINVIRLKELKDTKSEVVASACPHCLTMLTSAQAQQKEGAKDEVLFLDVAEIVAQQLESAAAEETSGSQRHGS